MAQHCDICVLFVYALLGSVGYCVCGVPHFQQKSCPLVDNLCNINTHNKAEWCFSHFFFTFYIFSYQPLYTQIHINRGIVKIGWALHKFYAFCVSAGIMCFYSTPLLI